MNFLEKKVRSWLLSFLFKEGIKVGTNTVYVYPTYIDMGSGELRSVGSVNSDLIPISNNTKNMGSTALRWYSIFGTYGNFTNLSGSILQTSNVSSNFIPDASNTRDLGSGAISWKNLYIAGNVVGNLIPSIDGNYTIGNATSRFHIHVPVTSSKPTAGATYLGRLIATRTTGKTTLFICLQNSSGTYEWDEVAIST